MNKIKNNKAQTFKMAGADNTNVAKIAFKCSNFFTSFNILVILKILIPRAIWGIILIKSEFFDDPYVGAITRNMSKSEQITTKKSN